MEEDHSKHKIRDFTDLLAWQEGHKLVLCVYEETRKFPNEERLGLSSQIRRASVSITSNIAEGFGRRTYKDKLNFYYMAQGSLIEVKNQLMIARDVKYLSGEVFDMLLDKADLVHKLLQGLISKTKSLS